MTEKQSSGLGGDELIPTFRARSVAQLDGILSCSISTSGLIRASEHHLIALVDVQCVVLLDVSLMPVSAHARRSSHTYYVAFASMEYLRHLI
jgi:hypothetical protein